VCVCVCVCVCARARAHSFLYFYQRLYKLRMSSRWLTPDLFEEECQDCQEGLALTTLGIAKITSHFCRPLHADKRARGNFFIVAALSFQGSWKSALYMQIAFKRRSQVVIVRGYGSKVALTSLLQCLADNYRASSDSSSSPIL